MPVPDLSRHGLAPTGPIHANLSAAELVEHAIRRGEGQLADSGAFNALTGERTARSPDDKYIVREPGIDERNRLGQDQQAARPRCFRSTAEPGTSVRQHAASCSCIDAAACAEPSHRIALRVVAEQAWHALFAQCLFLRPTADQLATYQRRMAGPCRTRPAV